MSVLKHTRFGEIDYDESQFITFPRGLLGFESLRKFIVIPAKNNGPLFWIQSLDDAQIAFVVTDPTNFFPNYGLSPESSEREILELEDGQEIFILSIATIGEDKEITLNLMAPILFSPGKNRAIQVIIENCDYKTNHALPKV